MTGAVGMRKCSTCHGNMVARVARGNVYFFGLALTRYHLALERARRWLYIFEIMGSVLFMVLMFGLGVWVLLPLLQPGPGSTVFDVFTLNFWLEVDHLAKTFIGFGFLGVCWFIYRFKRAHTEPKSVEVKPYGDHPLEQEVVLSDWKDVRKFPRNRQIDLVDTYTSAAVLAVERAYALADTQNSSQLQAEHIFVSLLEDPDIKGIFIRLGIPVKLLSAKIAESFVKQKGERAPLPNDDAVQILFHAYEQAYDAREPQVHVTELLLATVGQSPHLQDVLYDIEIDSEKLYNVVEWVRIRQRLRRQYHATLAAGTHVSKKGMDRAMTAIATPFLNQFSQDITLSALRGHLPPCVAREKEIEDVFRVVESGTNSVVLVGDHGVGKMTMIEGIVQRMIEGSVPVQLQDKRFVQVSTTALLAGTTVSGAQERLLNIMSEVLHSKNIILFINNIHDLIGGQGDGTGLDVSESLGQFVGNGQALLFATTTPEQYNKSIVNSQLGKRLTKVDIPEMTVNQTVQVLEAQAGMHEYKQKVFFSYDALAAAAQMAGKFMHDSRLPDSAIQIIAEAASYTKSQKGEHQLVERDDVAHIIEEKTGIKASSITEDESAKLLRLEEQMHERVVGQDEAVNAVANALRRARAEIRSTNRPIATFLFLGSTGVGKTELAKTISEVYFGGENRMIRVDMSEFQDNRGVYRLIGEPGQQGTGLLTESVRQQPFSLVLLDEIEKADPRILDLFLQVFDDGRLTDSVGRVIDFTNTIIIATSNAGTSFVQEGIREGKTPAEIQEALLRGELKKSFRPEFLNRFDGITVFTPLTQEDVKHIAGLMIQRVAKEMLAKGVTLQVTDQGLDELATAGYDPEYGARPMRRAIQDLVENKLAEMMLSGQIQRKDTVIFDGTTGIRVEHA